MRSVLDEELDARRWRRCNQDAARLQRRIEYPEAIVTDGRANPASRLALDLDALPEIE